MNPATAVLWGAALVMFGYGPVYFLALAVRERRMRREDDRRRVEQDRQVSAEWLAVLAAVDPPQFAEEWADSLRRDLEEWSA